MTDNYYTSNDYGGHDNNFDGDALPDPDDDYPDLTAGPGGGSNDPTNFVKPNKGDISKGKQLDALEYILGTLVIRVVAARDLEPAQKGGIGQIVFGGSRSGRRSEGTANPYASVKFGNSTQRTSEVFDSLDPTWPRQEAMFMDVSLPMEELTYPEPAGMSSQTAAAAPPIHRNSTTRSSTYRRPSAILTVALFHTPEIGRTSKYPLKGGVIVSGDSDDQFLGMASVDLTRLFTGRENTFDQWLQLSGTQTSRGSVRIACEYEPSDPPPRPGDLCKFTRYCHPKDLYPLEPGRKYRVAERNGDVIVLTYKTLEGWDCTFQAHRFMLICSDSNHNPVETAQDELASVAERLSHSPLLHSVTHTVERVAVDGLLHVGEEIAHGGISLLNRWFSGGIGTIVDDITRATNWDGRYNPNNSDRLDIPDLATSESNEEPKETPKVVLPDPDESEKESQLVALPNMPACPITGEPMIDPVVAADGHTYERSAISRWLMTSNKSPLTGSVLSHKELVPNYGLLSSVEASALAAAAAHPARRSIFDPEEVDKQDSTK